MATFLLPHFEPINLNTLDSYYSVDVEFDGRAIQIDLNFDNTSIDAERMIEVKNFIDNIAKFDELNKGYIKNDYDDEEGDTTRYYLEHHLEELDQEVLSGLVNLNETEVGKALQLMQKLKLKRVGLYPDSENSFATFDYSIDPELTDYLVVVNTGVDGDLIYLTMES